MFDIDKLYLSTVYYHKGKDGKMTTEYKEGTKEYYANDLIKCYLALLTDKDESGKNRTAHLQHAPIDSDTDLLKDVLNDIEEGKAPPIVTPYSNQAFSILIQTKDEFITGKFGIGPFALNNNSHILTRLYGVEFSEIDQFGEKIILARLGLTSLHNSIDRDGKLISAWISGLINAHVDVAKDAYISRLGVNKYTYNLTNLLIRTGLGKTTLYMLTLPIMKKLSTAYNAASGAYMRPNGLTLYQAQKQATEAVIFEEFSKLGISGKMNECIKAFNDYMFNQYKMSYLQAIEALFSKDNGVLREISKNGIIDGHVYGVEVNGTKQNLTGDEVQLLVAVAKLKLDPYAQGLADLVKYSKIDTNKHGKNIVEQRQYLQGFHKIFDKESTSRSRTMFKTDGLDRMANSSYIRQKTENATSVFADMLKDLILEATDAVYNSMKRIMWLLNCDEDSTGELINKITKKILVKIKSNFFFGDNGYCARNGINPKDLISGENTIYDRLNRIKQAIITESKYADLRDGSGEIANYLLRSLVPSVVYRYNPTLNPALGNRPDTYTNAKFVKLFNFTEEDTIDQDTIIEAWEELLRDKKYPEIQEFARDLIVYSFMTSGDGGGFVDLFKYVPNSWKLGKIDAQIGPFEEVEDQSYAAFIERQLEDAKNLNEGLLTEEDITDVLQNSWYDDDIVPVKSSTFISNSFDNITIPGLANPSILIPKRGSDVADLPLVFKYKREGSADRFSQRQYDLYAQRVINGRPVYVAVDPKGGKYLRGHYIYEMSRQDNTVADNAIPLLGQNVFTNLAVQLGLSTKDMSTFLEQLIDKLDKNPGFGPALVEAGLLDERILGLSTDMSMAEPPIDTSNPALDTKPVPSESKEGVLKINPTKDADKKASAKGSISNKFIGFADGIVGSSTTEYAKVISEIRSNLSRSIYNNFENFAITDSGRGYLIADCVYEFVYVNDGEIEVINKYTLGSLDADNLIKDISSNHIDAQKFALKIAGQELMKKCE